MNPGRRVLVFTGDGKGKTTAALGLVLRAVGHGQAVAVVQFIKANSSTGEIQALAHLPGVRFRQTGRGFLPPPEDPAFAEHQEAARRGLLLAEEVLRDGPETLVVLDEVLLAVSRGLLEEARVLEVIEGARPGTCLVLTGRGATEGIVAAADTVTEMRAIKHGFQAGIAAQAGVEW